MSQFTLFACNPSSRSGNRDLAAICERLEALGDVSFQCPDQPKDLPDIIRRHGSEAERIIIGGGDGTINLVLDALVECKRPVGIIPLGTANDLVRSLGIASNTGVALDIIVHGHTRHIDVARANDVSFVNAIGMGLGPRMTKEMSAKEKSRFGSLAYLFGIARAFKAYPRFHARIQCDDQEWHGQCLQVTVANGIHYGGGMTAAADAKLDDGKLDVLIVRHRRRLHLLGHALDIRTGDTKTTGAMRHYRGRRVTVETSPAQEVTADGEFLTETPVTCTVRKNCLEVYAPEP